MSDSRPSTDDARHAVTWLHGTTRRQLLGAGLALGASGNTPAVQPGRRATIGWLSDGWSAEPNRAHNLVVAISTLSELGWREGDNLAIEWRYAEGDRSRLPGMAQDLVDRQVDLIVVNGTGGTTQAAAKATTRIPIVVIIGLGLVEAGLVQSLRRPGTNITGLVWEQSLAVMGKYPELLAEAIPGLKRLGGLYDATESGLQPYREELIRVAAKLGIAMQHADYRKPEEVDAAVESLAAWRAQAMFVYGSATSVALAPRIEALAARHRIADMHVVKQALGVGALMYYGPNLEEVYRRAPRYIDRILKGANPAEMPIEQPSNYELGLNLRTARKLGLTIPASLRVRADELIE